MKTLFYDIESLENVFTICCFTPKNNELIVYYLCDDDNLTPTSDDTSDILTTILEKNKNLNASCQDGYCNIILRDLREAENADALAMTFGLHNGFPMNNPAIDSDYDPRFRIVCDTDPEYDEDIHPYLAGYNSFNYDTTMMTLFLYESYPKNPANRKAVPKFSRTNAKLMRKYNDLLFTDQFKGNMPSFLQHEYNVKTKIWENKGWGGDRSDIRRNMISSGRHLDIARLNEKQQHVALKRLLGMLGYQILESDKLHGQKIRVDTKEELFELIAYNASDVVNLFWLSLEPIYQGQFSLKKGLLNTYPELIYDKRVDAYAPHIAPHMVRRDRLTIDSSSAQFATKTLCPYGHLKDIPSVSFLYPTENKAKELGIKQVDVLEEFRKFIYRNFSQQNVRDAFDVIYEYYAAIRGKNFNDSKNYQQDYAKAKHQLIPHSLSDIPKPNLCVPYFAKDGSPTSCFVNFSTGGIHGAEYNKALWDADVEEYETALALMNEVQHLYPEPTELRKAKQVTLSNGETYSWSAFLKSGSTLKQSHWKNLKAPVLFPMDSKGNSKLHKRYVYTSAYAANHEDFESYYPNMLRMMEAFYNEGLGEDRYAKIFFQKREYGNLMKDKTVEEAMRALYSVLRDGTKLILNSASGAGDTNFESNIRMNNRIISMRIIGQLFSARIGIAQTLAGAMIPSTNTDGLYSVLEATLNNQILAREAADIGVDIKPEPLFLISKDSNNRLEYDEGEKRVISASGGTLGCMKGPSPTKSLAHPAILDWATAQYLLAVAHGEKNLTLNDPFDDKLGMEILKRAKQEFEPVKWLIMMQNVIASSIGSITYNFGLKPGDKQTRPVIMQHYNRVFIMKDDTPDTLYLRSAVARKITPAMQKTRQREGSVAQVVDPVAFTVLSANGVTKTPPGTDVTCKKVVNIEENWNMYVCNKDLHLLSSEEVQFIEENIDLEKYLKLVRKSYTDNWKNHIPGEEFSADETEEETA